MEITRACLYAAKNGSVERVTGNEMRAVTRREVWKKKTKRQWKGGFQEKLGRQRTPIGADMFVEMHTGVVKKVLKTDEHARS